MVKTALKEYLHPPEGVTQEQAAKNFLTAAKQYQINAMLKKIHLIDKKSRKHPGLDKALAGMIKHIEETHGLRPEAHSIEKNSPLAKFNKILECLNRFKAGNYTEFNNSFLNCIGPITIVKLAFERKNLSAMKKLIKDQLKSEFSTENYKFLKGVHAHLAKNKHKVEIIENFCDQHIKSSAPLQINIPAAERVEILENVEYLKSHPNAPEFNEKASTIFDKAQAHIEKLCGNDSFRRLTKNPELSEDCAKLLIELYLPIFLNEM